MHFWKHFYQTCLPWQKFKWNGFQFEPAKDNMMWMSCAFPDIIYNFKYFQKSKPFLMKRLFPFSSCGCPPPLFFHPLDLFPVRVTTSSNELQAWVAYTTTLWQSSLFTLNKSVWKYLIYIFATCQNIQICFTCECKHDQESSDTMYTSMVILMLVVAVDELAEWVTH